MPAKSQAQRGFLAHKFGSKWMKKHHYDNPGKLPQHVGKKQSQGRPSQAQKPKRR